MNNWGGKRENAGGSPPNNPNPRRGSNHYRAVLVEADIPIIRQLYMDGLSCRQIAEKFEVTRDTIYKVISYQNWWSVR